MTLQEAKDTIANKEGYTSWDWIIAEYPANTKSDKTTEEMLEDAANLCIASLESQLMEKDREIDRYKLANKAYLASVDGALNEYLEKQKRFLDDIEEKDKEIERLKIDASNYAYQCDRAKRDRYIAETMSEELREALREAIRQWTLARASSNSPDFLVRCRKLIGD
jgi:SMC interacting uncharacterized protein involved in chromosome segregation